MLTITTSLRHVKTDRIFALASVHQPGVDTPWFYCVAPIPRIGKLAATILKKINDELPGTIPISVRILSLHDTIDDARTAIYSAHIERPANIPIESLHIGLDQRVTIPAPKLPAKRTHRKRRAVRCIDTNVTYETAAAAAFAAGVSEQRMSAHLNGRIGYKTICGKRYERVSE